MALAIGQALESRSHLLVEAPTGVGKTLAYLIPSILHARANGRKAIISTHTKNLQEQLFCKDIPLIRSLLKTEFSAVMFKGRRNYLCTTRLRNALRSTGYLFSTEEAGPQLERIHEWSQSTADGDMESLGFVPHPEVWDLVCSEPDSCSLKVCGAKCFYQRAKEKAREADVVIMNHALFFTLLALQDTEERFLFDNDFVIFDEAHTLEAVAAAGIGLRISKGQLFSLLGRIQRLKLGRHHEAGTSKNVKHACRDVEEAAKEFFHAVVQAASALDTGTGNRGARNREIRIRSPHVVADTLAMPLARLDEILRKASHDDEESPDQAEILLLEHRIAETMQSLETFLEQSDAGFAYWVELSDSAGRQVSLCSSPCDVGEIIGPRLFRDNTSVIMTSATLAVNSDVDYFKKRIGAAGVEALVLGSPFDHARQMRLCIARDIPEPDSPQYQEALSQWILQSLDRSHGKALVLFTNGVLMRSIASSLGPALEERGWRLLVQGPDQHRHVLLEEFRRDVHSVLFGLDSFWMGVDVPGEALEHVVITRLPFAVPNHPLIEARLEAIAARGGNSFFEYSLPEAVLKFRQGAGRLLRSKFDTGMVTLLDSRVIRKSYGRTFISSLPPCPIELISSNGQIDIVEPEMQ